MKDETEGGLHISIILVTFGVYYLIRPYYCEVWSLIIGVIIGAIFGFFLLLYYDSLAEKESKY